MLKRLQTAFISSLLFIAGIVVLYSVISLIEGREGSPIEATNQESEEPQANWSEQLENLRFPANEMTEEESLDIGGDPNLEMPDRNKTEADVCYNCGLSYSPEVSQKNYQSLQDISLGLANAPYHSAIDPNNPVWSQFPEVMSYAEGDLTTDAIELALKNKRPSSVRSCYRFVKFALGDARNKPKAYAETKSQAAEIGPEPLVPDPLGGSQAKAAVDELKAQSFVNLLDERKYRDLIQRPGDAPKGAVLVYEHQTKKNHAGHIEIKTDWGDNGGYVSDFLRLDHDEMSGRVLIGVMIRLGGS